MPTWMVVLIQVVVILGIIVFAIVMWWRKFTGRSSSSNSTANTMQSQNKSQKGWIIRDKNGIERKLLFLEKRTDYTGKPPFYGKDYNLYKDDIGNYWRSYDNDESFISAEEYNRRNL